jgi:hypothetical protein
MFPILALFLSNEVYLCICDNNNINMTCNCKSFKSFIEADNYYKNHYYNQNNENNNNNKNKHISTMISTEYIPHLLKKYYLNYNLSKLLLKCNLV